MKFSYETLNGLLYKKKWLYGLVKLKFYLNTYFVTYSFLGLKFAKRTFYNGYSIYTIFKIFKITTGKKHTQNFLGPILCMFIQKQGKYTDIIGLFNRSGETFLFLHYIESFIKNNNFTNPVFVSIYNYHKDLIEMFKPEIPCIIVPRVFYELYLLQVQVQVQVYSSARFIIPLPHSHFLELEKALQNGEKRNFYIELCKTAGLTNHTSNSYRYLPKVCNLIDNEMKQMNLKRPFVFITTSAQSNPSMSIIFWRKIAIELTKRHFDVFFNEPQPFGQGLGYKNVYYTLPEAKYLAEKADIIIGIRSGLMDVIANNKSKIFCIYTPFFDRGLDLPPLEAQKVIDAFTLKCLPNVNKQNIYEYNAQTNGEDIILEKILNTIDELHEKDKTK